MTEHVVLLHGLWLRAFTLGLLRRRLERQGFSTGLFDYASVLDDPQANIDRLIAHLCEIQARTAASRIHLVGHSLGGLIALGALEHWSDQALGRIVCLGSPLRGSALVRYLEQWPGGATVVGKSCRLLERGLAGYRCPCQVGMIAGAIPIGLGGLLGALERPHDGTVSVAETQLPGLTDHCIVPASHTGLLFSARAADQTLAFLRNGQFKARNQNRNSTPANGP